MEDIFEEDGTNIAIVVYIGFILNHFTKEYSINKK
jgi:hypothetical protein